MSYLDQRTSPARIWALGVVAILHVLIGIAFVTGFYQRFTKEGVKDLDVFDVEEPPPPEEEPPPPEEIPEPVSPQVVAPPPIVRTNVPPPPSPPTQAVIPPPSPPSFVATPPRPAPPTPPAVQAPPPPPPSAPPTPARLRSGSVSNADYPSSAIRSGASGTTRITLSVDASGRATGCTVSGSSGNSSLDSTACSLAQRRFRFTPATRDGQNVAGSYSQSIRWVLPDD
jgi:protein TonB